MINVVCKKGRKKTSERIRYSFFWPKMKQDIHNYSSSCLPCQQTRRLVKTDQVPTKAIPRNNLLPGEHHVQRVSAKHGIKDDFAFLWEHAIFRHPPNKNHLTNRSEIVHS
jgi:hypothetical protein